MNKKKKKNKTLLPLIHPTQVELANMVAKARKEAEEAMYRVEIVKGRLQEIIDEANMTNPLIPYIQPQDTEGLINIWSSVANQVSKLNMNLDTIRSSTDSASSTATISSATISGVYTDDRLITDSPEFQSTWIPYVEFVSDQAKKIM